ncbi:uncharacterized protein FPRO_12382 [Fusarium proliferatum ET1]|uniref:FAD dependent oxidoreductase domain-containing protein n=1 Tax=Fusarium proliferatum (strain ET1) TaxID=1227346 RepID=A0A1L7W8N3_FUSPR|nr:uncharacterized protein FPRO_12382 [Fusarium proliferatum ET1]CZR48942.1 uncharacterized protein FPRO_12382 [Fusarium proliferatum ET1]
MENNNAIIIVGAGCIGLCTAYELSKSFDDQERMPRIIVAEACDRPFAAASSACTGDGKGLERLPNWIKTETSWDVDNQVLGVNTATVNPLGLGKWLTQQCLARGVRIMLNSEILGVELPTLNGLQAITLRINSQQKATIACKQMLLACGPWTPTVFQRLFPAAPIRLRWTTDAGDWIIFRNPRLATLESTAFVSFEPLIGEKFEFAGRNDGTIWACGRRNFEATLPSPGQSNEPDQELIQEISELAHKWLNLNCTHPEWHCDDVQILGKGRAFRRATESGLPVMSEVTSSGISPKDASVPTGIFVCWGHGSWGLTLGMGSGRVMSQLMREEKPDIDISRFSLEQGTIPAELHSKSL